MVPPPDPFRAELRGGAGELSAAGWARRDTVRRRLLQGRAVGRLDRLRSRVHGRAGFAPLLEGMIALVDSDKFPVAGQGSTNMDLSARAWVHLVGGVILLVSACVSSAARPGRALGVA